jgi:hypothetical protein
MAPSAKTFVWYELMTTDMDSAAAFYRAVVGWSAQSVSQPDMRYTVMSADDKMVAGVMTLTAEVCDAGGRPGWIGYIGVDDVDVATAGVKKAGGTIHRPPEDIPNIGRFSVVADPQGAVFMLFKPAGGDNSPAPGGTQGHIGWRELYTSDWPSAFDFYAGQFGWTKAEAIDMGSMGTYQLFAAGGDAIGGMMNTPVAIPSPHWLFYFNVAEAEAAAARVAAHGGQVLMGPQQVPGGSWIMQGVDPQGAAFALVAPTR